MVYIKEYWDNKNERAKIAQKHTRIMEEKYSEEILECISSTKLYSTYFKYDKESPKKEQKIILKSCDSVTAVFEEIAYTNNVAVLNFASYKNPGGMFINGSIAQEECLCHESFLYNVLREFPDYYEWNSRHKNKALYMNRALYSPNIIFEKNDKKASAGVITCAAPNISTGRKYQNVSDEENLKSLRKRIKFILDIAIENNVESLILGAFGCGVFGQNPTDVASIFKMYLQREYKGYFNRIVFAIPDKNGENYKKFKEVFIP